MKRKIVSLVCAVLMFASLMTVVSCGGSSSSSSSSSDSSTASISGSGN